MLAKKRDKVLSTPFSNFIRNASDEEKRQFFSKVIKQTIAEQRAMIEQAKKISKES